MRRLISLISTEGKTAEQISSETMKAFKKYQKVKKKVNKELKQK